MNKKETISCLILIGVASCLSRLIPHPPNFTPVLAIALFCGSIFPRKQALLINFVSLLISNLILGLSWISYSSMLLLCVLSLVKINYKNKAWIGASLLGPLYFFITSNALVWISGKMYPYSFEGLIQCYLAAIPFFSNTLISTLLYSFLIFNAYKLMKRTHLFSTNVA